MLGGILGNGVFCWNIQMYLQMSVAHLSLRWASRSHLVTVDVETGVWVPFNEAASCGNVRRLFLKLDTWMYLSFFLVVHRGPPTSLYILVRARLCYYLKGVVHTVLGNLQFLGNSSHGIALISQTKNRLLSLRRKFSFSGHFESKIKPTNADAPDTQLAQRKATFIASLISTTVFSCANIIAQGFSHHQLAF